MIPFKRGLFTKWGIEKKEKFLRKKSGKNLEIQKEYLPLHSPNGTRVLRRESGEQVH